MLKKEQERKKMQHKLEARQFHFHTFQVSTKSGVSMSGENIRETWMSSAIISCYNTSK
jgi:hypothetical protein